MTVRILGRNVIRQKPVTLAHKDPKKSKNAFLAIFDILPQDGPLLRPMHNEKWVYPWLHYSPEEFELYTNNFGHIGKAAYIVLEEDPSRPIAVGGINAMRVKLSIHSEGSQPDCWRLTHHDKVARKWNILTNKKTCDLNIDHGPYGRIWPHLEGKTIICPTVYALNKVMIDGESYNIVIDEVELEGKRYKLGSLMEQLILAVKDQAQILANTELRTIYILAYSTPMNYGEWYKKSRADGVTDTKITDYLRTTQVTRLLLEVWQRCATESGVSINSYTPDDVARVVERKTDSLYTAYVKSGGKMLKDQFAQSNILAYSLMQQGQSPYFEYAKKFLPHELTIEQFTRDTGRLLVDTVIGKHVLFGANITKILPRARFDPRAGCFNIIMSYGGVDPEVQVKSEKSARVGIDIGEDNSTL
jgi:hypothetical protein